MRLAAVLAVCLLALPAAAQDWRVVEAGSGAAPQFAESCQRPSGGLPDGCVARATGDVRAAWYSAPTQRYAHAILGDAIEAGALVAQLADGTQLTLTLPESLVFEDRTPRLADLDGDGRREIITIRASLAQGGSVAVYGVRGGSLVELGATPFIGRANRWLNIAGIADFLGRGGLQVAFVETPHIGGTLKLASFDGQAMRVVAQAGGFSNHEIHSREQRLSAVTDIDGDGIVDLALPDAQRTSLVLVRMANGGIETLARVALPSPVVQPVVATGSGAGLQLTTGLADGRIVRIQR